MSFCALFLRFLGGGTTSQPLPRDQAYGSGRPRPNPAEPGRSRNRPTTGPRPRPPKKNGMGRRGVSPAQVMARRELNPR